MITIFDTKEQFNTYTNNGQNIPSGFLYYVKEDETVHFNTNNIDGTQEIKNGLTDPTQEGYIIPTGNVSITSNGSEIDVAPYSTASVNVPIPEGYIIPSGNKSITTNGENIDVNDYATATVNVPVPPEYIIPTGNKEITQNGTGIDIAQYATASVAVPQPSGNITLTENGENINIAQYATATVNVAGSGGNEDLIDLIERDITSINIPSGTTTIGQYAFYKLTSLTSVTIPNSVTSIGDYAFSSCTGLTSVTIPSGVTEIKSNAFYQCTGLTSVTIPSSVRTFQDSINGCKSLPFIYLPYDGIVGGLNSNTMASMDYNYSIFYVPQNRLNSYISTYTNSKGLFLSYPRVNNHSEIVMNCSVSSNKNVKLFNTTAQITKVYLDNVEQEITDTYYMTAGDHTVRAEIYDSRIVPHLLTNGIDKNCDIDMTLPNGIEIITMSSFQNRSIKNVTIPNSVTEIDGYAFAYNSNLSSVTILATTPPTLGSGVFSSTNNCPIYVPAESVETYKAASGWSTYASRIQAIPTT